MITLQAGDGAVMGSVGDGGIVQEAANALLRGVVLSAQGQGMGEGGKVGRLGVVARATTRARVSCWLSRTAGSACR